ncbi:MAG TPA: ChpI protein [Rectinema sp.]|jgi:metal-responsive CopG/Arc/MetJ family transcriptional regulator|nr:ChpI protein [Rectinema sp.]
MKTAISLPDRLYKQAEKVAKSLGIPRSQLVAKALQEFISRHTQDHITEDLNKVYSNQQQTAFDSTIEDASIESIRELTKNDAW